MVPAICRLLFKLASDAIAQLIEQSRLSIWYRVGHALFPVYLMLYLCTVSCQSLTSIDLWPIKEFCITAADVHNGRQLS